MRTFRTDHPATDRFDERDKLETALHLVAPGVRFDHLSIDELRGALDLAQGFLAATPAEREDALLRISNDPIAGLEAQYAALSGRPQSKERPYRPVDRDSRLRFAREDAGDGAELVDSRTLEQAMSSLKVVPR